MRAAVVLSLFWFLSLAGLGIFFPFYTLYLTENAALSGSQAGVIAAALPLVGMVAQPVWGHAADMSGWRGRLLAALSLGTAAAYVLLYAQTGFSHLLAATAVLALFSSALIPMAVSVSFAALQQLGGHAFGFVRVWGTVGFLVAVIVFPRWLDVFQAERGLAAVAGGPSEPGLEIMLVVCALLMTAAGLVGLALPRTHSLAVRARRGQWRTLLQHGPFLRLLLFLFASYLFMQGPISLFPIYVRSLGGDLDTVSRMWIFMLVLEIPLVALSGAGLARWGARTLVVVGLLAGAVRWIVCGVSSTLPLIYSVQILHGVTVAGLVIGAPLYVESVVPPELRSTGQGLLAMVGVSVGGILSNLASGWLIDGFGPAAPAAVGGVGALLLATAAPLLLPDTRRARA